MHEELLPKAQARVLVVYEEYDPEVHGESDGSFDPGDMIWVPTARWNDALAALMEGK